MRQVERFEDMSPTGRLKLLQQDDGDMIVSCIDGDGGETHVEFCMPMSGGGQSANTHEALRRLMVAMAQDELKRKQSRRYEDNRAAKTCSDDDGELTRLIAQELESRQAEKEFEFLRGGPR